MKHTRNILRTIVLAVAVIAVGYTAAHAEAVTYTISGSTEPNGNVNFTATYNVHFNARGGSGTGYADGQNVSNLTAALGFYQFTDETIPANKAYYVE